MNANAGRTCLAIALLSLSLAAALSVGLRALHQGVSAQAHTASMHLQSMAEEDDGSVAPNGDKDARCAKRDQRCRPEHQEVVLALSDDRQPQDGKALVAPLDETPHKSRN